MSDTGANPYHAYFVFYLKTFLSYLRKTYPLEDGVKLVLEKFEDLELKKVIKRFVQILDPYNKKINDKDESMFLEPIFFIPGIDLTRMWKMPTTTEENKDHIWLCLQMLLQMGRLLENKNTAEDKDSIDKLFKGKKQDKKMSVNSLMESHKNSPPTSSKDDGPELDIGSIMNIPGLGNMMNFDSFGEQLSKISDEDIASATEKMKQILGNDADVDSKVGDVMGDVVKDMFSELKKGLSAGGGAGGFLNVVKSVSEKMKGKLEQNNINDEQMVGFATKSLQKLGLTNDVIANISTQVMSGNTANIMDMIPNLANFQNMMTPGQESASVPEAEPAVPKVPKVKKGKKVKKAKK